MNDINGPQQCRTPEGHGEVGDTSRAFAQGTGVLLQTVGGILFLSSCCVCSSAFLWDPQWSLIQAQSYQQQQIDGQPPISAHHITKPARFGLMLMVMFTTVGGGAASPPLKGGDINCKGARTRNKSRRPSSAGGSKS